MRLALTLLLLLLVSCAESPSRPTTAGGSSSGTGKVETTTPEEPYECDSDLILEPHLPEECIPPEPPEPVVQKPVEPPKPDPIVGTYRQFYVNSNNRTSVIRVSADGKMIVGKTEYRWEKVRGGNYRIYYARTGEYVYPLAYVEIDGEPEIKASVNKFSDYEAIKLSNDPKFLFDLYKLGGHPNWECYNIGRNEIPSAVALWEGPHTPPDFSESLDECESLCPAVRADLTRIRQNNGAPPRAETCPQDRK